MGKEKIKTIYDLKLHEELWIKGSLTVERVPGGWNYKYYEYKAQQFNENRDWELVEIVFVPFNNWFQPISEDTSIF